MVAERRAAQRKAVERSRASGTMGAETAVKRARPMPISSLPDLLAIVWFLGAWIAYSVVIE